MYGLFHPHTDLINASVVPGCASTKGDHCQGVHHKSAHTVMLMHIYIVMRVHCRITEYCEQIFCLKLFERLFCVGHSDLGMGGGAKPS